MTDTWGDEFPISEPDWDLIIASDILLCKYPFPIPFYRKTIHIHFYIRFFTDVKQYQNLIKSLTFLLKTYKPTNAVSPTECKLNGQYSFLFCITSHTHKKKSKHYSFTSRSRHRSPSSGVLNELETKNWERRWVSILYWLRRSWPRGEASRKPSLLHQA